MAFPVGLRDLFNDLVTERYSDVFLARVLARPAGRWTPLRDLIDGLADFRTRFARVEKALKAPPMVTWLKHPFHSRTEDYAVILCFAPDRIASGVAIANRAALPRKRLAKPRW